MQKPIRKLPIRRRGDKWILDLRKLPSSSWPEGCRSGRVTYETKAQAEGAAALALADREASVNLAFDLTPEHRRVAVEAFRVMEGYPLGDMIEAAREYKKLTPEHRRVAVEAFRVMEGYPLGDMIEAAREYIARHDPNAPKKSCGEVYSEMVKSKRGAGCSEVTLRNLRNYLGRWVADVEDIPVHEVETVDLERWMDSQARPITGEHRRNYRRLFRQFFKFAEDRMYIRRNPAIGIARVTRVRRMPGIIHAGDLQCLLDAAADYSGGIMLPYFVLLGLAGLRPSEARRLDWEQINLEAAEVYLSPEVVGKTYTDRFVHLQPNAVAWLELIPKTARRGRIHWTRGNYEGCRKLAGPDVVEKMKATKDVLRHSSASHLYAMTRSIDQVTANHGHDIRIFLKHYRAAVSHDEGLRYFAVMPGGRAGSVIPIEKAATN